MSAERSVRAPVHLWIIGVLSLLWGLVGAWDYLMTMTRNEAYMAQFTEEQLEFFYGFPAWLVAFWAIAVWGGVLGSLLLLLRRRLAVGVFVASFLAMLVTMVQNYGFADGVEISGAGGVIFSIVIFLAALALVFYARAMSRRGVLA